MGSVPDSPSSSTTKPPVIPRAGTWHGRDCLEYQTAQARLVTVPSLGGRIVSLTDPAGREWLVQPTPGRIERPTCTASYASIPPYGWDELVPTINPCSYRGRLVPDHGDAWHTRWRVEPAQLVFTDPAGRYVLSRAVLNHSAGLTLTYRLAATEPVALLWAAHPLFQAPPGSALLLPEAVTCLVRVDAGHTEAVPAGQAAVLPEQLQTGEHRKYYSPQADHPDWAQLIRPDGTALRLDWTTEIVPHLGIYAENRCFTTEQCIALEPTTSWFDNLTDTIQNGTALKVGPKTTLDWSMRISLSQQREPTALKEQSRA